MGDTKLDLEHGFLEKTVKHKQPTEKELLMYIINQLRQLEWDIALQGTRINNLHKLYVDPYVQEKDKQTHMDPRVWGLDEEEETSTQDKSSIWVSEDDKKEEKKEKVVWRTE